MKKILIFLSVCLFGAILLIALLTLSNTISKHYNYKYSIAMPTIIGEYSVSNDFIKIAGLNNIKKQ